MKTMTTYFKNIYCKIINLVIEVKNEEDTRKPAYGYFIKEFDLYDEIEHNKASLEFEKC